MKQYIPPVRPRASKKHSASEGRITNRLPQNRPMCKVSRTGSILIPFSTVNLFFLTRPQFWFGEKEVGFLADKGCRRKPLLTFERAEETASGSRSRAGRRPGGHSRRSNRLSRVRIFHQTGDQRGCHSCLPTPGSATSTVVMMPSLTGSGRFGHASITRRKSASTGPETGETAPDSAPLAFCESRKSLFLSGPTLLSSSPLAPTIVRPLPAAFLPP